MEITLDIDDAVLEQLSREAAREGRTMSELVDTALRDLFRALDEAAKLPPLPTFHGRMAVDPANRDELCRIMEEEE